MTKIDPIEKELNLITACLDEHKAEDIFSIDVRVSSPFASYAVIATASNPRLLGALQNHVEEDLEKNGFDITVKEGEPDSGWVIIQGEEVIVHLMLPANRRVLDLETLLEQVNNAHTPKKRRKKEEAGEQD